MFLLIPHRIRKHAIKQQSLLSYCLKRKLEMNIFIKVLPLFGIITSSHLISGLQSSCNHTDITLQICEGSNSYIPSYPSTYPGKALAVQQTLTLLNLADFNPYSKTVTIFVTLATKWNDSRLSLTISENVPK